MAERMDAVAMRHPRTLLRMIGGLNIEKLLYTATCHCMKLQEMFFTVFGVTLPKRMPDTSSKSLL